MRTRLTSLVCAALSACLLSTVPAPAAAATTPDRICTPAPANATWTGRTSDDSWARGIYPAHDDIASNTVALTFDDGPHRSRTPVALDLLEARDFSATFFLTGAAIRPSTYHLVQRIVAEGHVLGNHGWRHDPRMARRFDDPQQSEAYMASEFELTQIRVDLAMMATSKKDFSEMSKEVFGPLARRSNAETQLAAMPALRVRHAAVLAEHGFSEDNRPYRIEWARPPGGNPYLGHHNATQRNAFARALDQQGLALVMWNGGSGDSNPQLTKAERQDTAHLQKTVRKVARRGGVYVMHDRIDPASLRTVLAAFVSRETEVVSLSHILDEKLDAAGRCTPVEGPAGAPTSSEPAVIAQLAPLQGS